MDTSSAKTNDAWMTIEELAAASKMTVRNIRAHQSRGTLPNPHMKGRKGYYDSTHLERLKKITVMQDRGYSLAAIQDLLENADPQDVQTRALAALNGWQSDTPLKMSLQDFRERHDFLFDKGELLQKAKEAGLIFIHDDQVEIPMPALTDVALSLSQHDANNALLPFLELTKRTQENLQLVAQDVVATFVEGVMLKTGNVNVTEVVATFRPLGLATIGTLFSHAIEKEITALLESTTDTENRNEK
jgi:DNA-binding transcriptional MerR regulator